MMKKLCFSIVFVLVFSVSAYADRAISIPWDYTFDSDEWVSDLARNECGGTATHTTTGCYGGGCMKVIPPTSACTGGGINGGAVGLGYVTYSNISTIHIRFLIYFGDSWVANISNGGGGNVNKFILQQYPARTGILGFNKDGTYAAWGIHTSDGSYYDYAYATAPSRGWYADASIRIYETDQGDTYPNEGEWLSVEYFINVSGDEASGVYIYDQDGNSWSITGVDTYAIGTQTGFYLSYYNCYGAADANNYYLLDNIIVSDEYIGPPAGFVGGEAPANSIQGVSISPGAVSLATGVNSNVQCKEAEWPQSTLITTVLTELADTCKYDTSDVAYASMANTFSTTGGTTHTQAILFQCGSAYTYYIACEDVADTFDALFTLDNDPPPRRNISVH